MKKILTLLLIAGLAVSMFAGCGSAPPANVSTPPGNDNTPGSSSSSVSNSDNSSSGSTPASTPSGKIEYDEVIWDGEGVKVTLTGFDHSLGDWRYTFTLENKTDKNISVNLSSRVSVNGCMIENLAANSDRKNFVNAGETRDDTYLRFNPSYLEERGITQIHDFELTIFFLDSDDLSAAPLFISEPIALPAPDGPGAPQTFDVDGIVIFDEGGVKISVIRQDYDIYDGSYDGVWVFVENNSGMDVEVGVGPGGMECVVANGKVAFDYSTYPPSNGTIEERDLNTSVRAMDKQSGPMWAGETLFDRANPVTVTFDANGKAVSVQ